MKQQWIVTSGNASINNGIISYIPQWIKNNLGQNENVSAIVSSNINFESGTIDFKIVLNSAIDLAQVIFNTDTGPNLYIGINVLESLFGILKYDNQQKNWALLSGAGNSQSLELGKEYDIQIDVNGSVIKLFVNGVQVASTVQEIRKGQIKLAFRGNKEIIVKEFKVTAQKSKAFVVMQFTDEYNALFKEVIKPVCEEFDLECERADDYHSSNPIIEDIVNSIKIASVVIADITPDNPNVFYEVGYSHAIGKPTILLSDKKRSKLPFDLSSFRTLFYDNTIAGKTTVEEKLRKYLQNIFGK